MCRASKTKKLRELQNELHILNDDIYQVESHQAALPPAAEFLLLPGQCVSPKNLTAIRSHRISILREASSTVMPQAHSAGNQQTPVMCRAQ